MPKGTRLIVVLIGLCCTFTAAAGQTTISEVDRQDLQRAQELCKAEDYAAAAVVLEAVCKRQQTFADAHRLLGHTYHQLGRTDDARRELILAVQHGRLTPDILGILTQIDQQQNRVSTLLADLRLQLLMDPTSRDWQLLYADVLTSVGAMGEAEHIYQALIDADASQSDIWIRLGNVHVQRSETRQALAAFETAYYLGHDETRLPETIAGLWFNLGDARQAYAWYARAVQGQEDPPERLQLRCAELLFSLADWDRAREKAEALVESSEQAVVAKALLLLGQIAMQRDKPQEAVAWWDRAIKAGVSNPQLPAFLGSHYFNAGDYELAADYLKQHSAIAPPDKTLLRFLVLSLIRSGQSEQAKEQIRTYLEYFAMDEQAEEMIRTLLINRRG